MTFTITKTKLAIAVLAMALLVPVTAYATHTFIDVDDEEFYSGPADWAKENNITTGSPAGSDTFKPRDAVTRGESVTFLKRYNDNIVQPALDGMLLPVAYATVLDDATVVAGRSSGVTGSNVMLESTSAFCFYGLDFSFTSVTVTPLYEASNASSTVEIGYPEVAGEDFDCSGLNGELEIATLENGTWAPHGFVVTFFR